MMESWVGPGNEASKYLHYPLFVTESYLIKPLMSRMKEKSASKTVAQIRSYFTKNNFSKLTMH